MVFYAYTGRDMFLKVPSGIVSVNGVILTYPNYLFKFNHVGACFLNFLKEFYTVHVLHMYTEGTLPSACN